MNCTIRLKGQSALVTGANSGIGKGVAIALANEGANVVVNYVTHPEAAQDVVNEIKNTEQQNRRICEFTVLFSTRTSYDMTLYARCVCACVL